MLTNYAVVLVGIPARIIDGVMPYLKADFATAHVFISDRAKEFHDKRAKYDTVAIDAALEACATALYGRTKRPFSFCRRPGAHCAIRENGKGPAKCGKTNERACGIDKPDRLIVLYQPSHDDGAMLRALNFAAIARKIPASCYGHLGNTLSSIKQALQAAKSNLDYASTSVQRGPATPILLPLKNYNPKAVIGFLRDYLVRDNPVELESRFRHRFWNENARAYETDGGLLFSPATGALAHADQSDADTVMRALSGHYRLGISYDPGFHYDVVPKPPGTLKGLEFECVEKGVVRCKASNGYANVYPNDVVRVSP